MDPRIKSTLEYAVMAPSGDNCQPWLFKIKGLHVSLYNDPQKDTSLYNLKQRASLIAHGALIETIKIASPKFGLEPCIDYLPDRENINLIANIQFKECEIQPHPLFKSITERQTNRECYEPTQFTDNQIKTLTNISKNHEGQIKFILDEEKLKKLTTILSYNERLVFEEPNLHKFLFDQIRWTEKEIQETRDGLDINTLGLNSLDKFAFSYLQNWPLVKMLNKFGFSRIVQINSKRTLKTASTFIFITIPDTRDINYIYGGQVWQRLLLHLAREGLTAQPIVGLTCLIQANTEGIKELSITQKHKDLLKKIEFDIEQIIPKKKDPLLGIFRVGKAATTTRALRKKIDDLIL